MNLGRRIFLAAGLLLGLGLRAQDPWESGFKLTAASYPGAETAYLGQDRAFGLAIFGTYPFGQAGGVSFEGGYRFFPTTTHVVGPSSWEDKSDGYYATALYRHRLFFEGFQVHGGLRLNQYLTNRRSNFQPGDGSTATTKLRGNYATGVQPLLGVGFRLTGKYGLELNASPLELKAVDGRSKKGTLLELGLLIYL
ncbi:MAG: hypothetical protein HY823_02060 [Acidobacteria bacterium]|nr:hypothetical protein [Acidobacteriota bacterium]